MCFCLTDCWPSSGTEWLTVNLSSRCTAEGNRIFWSFCGLHALVFTLRCCVAHLLSSNQRAEGTVFWGRFPQGCEGTVTHSRLLDKEGGGLELNMHPSSWLNLWARFLPLCSSLSLPWSGGALPPPPVLPRPLSFPRGGWGTVTW